MNERHIPQIARELQVRADQVRATAALLADGSTVPFIARYRKEATGSLDEVAIAAVRDRLEKLEALDGRRAAIIESLSERGLLTDELQCKIDGAEAMAVLEDLYLPYRPKRRTRATDAREKGLEPLADLLFGGQDDPRFDPEVAAGPFVSAEKGVSSADEALAGARDILAERASEDATARRHMRDLFAREARLTASVVAGQEESGAKYADYFEWDEPAVPAPSHRILALFRAEKEGVLSLHARPLEDPAVDLLEGLFVKGSWAASEQVARAVRDGYRRLLAPSMETELRKELKRRADEEAIRVFAENVRELLLAPPLGPRAVLAIDPGMRTGCKLACLDRHGRLLHHETIYPHTGERKREEAAATVRKLVNQFGTEVIAVGNGTAGRETETFIRGLSLLEKVSVVMVNEAGASIYSASEVAREEFPHHDVTVRGAVSIGRRLMDPLAELVKIDPKSIGVGQYQHDVEPSALKGRLDDVVMLCVNRVGVNVNVASPQLLTYVSGLGASLARNIVAYREEHGPFKSRKQLSKVKGLGPKAFQQAAGFLRIPDGENPLDTSAVHPESYDLVDRMSRDLGCRVTDLLQDASMRRRIEPERYVDEARGLPTLRDILEELEKPGHDPRGPFEPWAFADGVNAIEDLAAGMRLPGIVTNVTAFGAFVDVGVHQDGLVHISQLADRFVKDPNEVVKVGQRVSVTVVSLDLPRRRIGLSMRSRSPA